MVIVQIAEELPGVKKQTNFMYALKALQEQDSRCTEEGRQGQDKKSSGGSGSKYC